MIRGGRLETGFSIVEALIALAILSTIATTMMLLSTNMTSSIQHGNMITDADNFITFVQDVLNQTKVPPVGSTQATLEQFQSPCDQALRGAGGAHLIWDPTTTPTVAVQQIVANGAVVASPGLNITPNLQINRMYLREPNPAFPAEGSPIRSSASRNGISYLTFVAKLVIEFQPANLNVSGGNLASRTADVVLMITPPASGNSVDYCFLNQPVQLSNLPTCSGNVYSAAFDCVGANPRGGADVTCTKTYFVSGFDSSGLPACACRWTCATPPPALATTWKNGIPAAFVGNYCPANIATLVGQPCVVVVGDPMKPPSCTVGLSCNALKTICTNYYCN